MSCEHDNGGEELVGELSAFSRSGIYRLPGVNATFVDPVRLLNFSYSRYRVSASGYYCRTFDSPGQNRPKKKIKRSRSHDLNEQEIIAERRHQEVRPLLLKAHEALYDTAELLGLLPTLVIDEESSIDGGGLKQNFIELGRLYQAPLYEIVLCTEENTIERQDQGTPLDNPTVVKELCRDAPVYEETHVEPYSSENLPCTSEAKENESAELTMNEELSIESNVCNMKSLVEVQLLRFLIT